MSRLLKLRTREMGDMPLFLIYETDGEWEKAWKPLQGSALDPLLTVVSKEVMDHALLGWTQPFVKALGLDGPGALRKMANPQCHQRARCLFYNAKQCVPLHPSMPWCFEPDGIEDPEARQLAAEIVSHWRAGVRVVLVQEVSDAAK